MLKGKRKQFAFQDGECWETAEYGFFAMMKEDGKLTVPEELRKKLKLEAGQWLKVAIDKT